MRGGKARIPTEGGQTKISGNSEKWETMIRILGLLKLFVLCCLLFETTSATGNKTHTPDLFRVYIYIYLFILVRVEVLPVSVNWFPGHVYGVIVEWDILKVYKMGGTDMTHFLELFTFPPLYILLRSYSHSKECLLKVDQ